MPDRDLKPLIEAVYAPSATIVSTVPAVLHDPHQKAEGAGLAALERGRDNSLSFTQGLLADWAGGPFSQRATRNACRPDWETAAEPFFWSVAGPPCVCSGQELATLRWTSLFGGAGARAGSDRPSKGYARVAGSGSSGFRGRPQPGHATTTA